MIINIKKGIPLSQSTPKNEKDLIEKFIYLHSVEDLIDLFSLNKFHFKGESIVKFLERLYVYNLINYRIKVKELKNTIEKAKKQEFIFKSEFEIKSESDEKLSLFFEEIYRLVDEKSKELTKKELVLILFEFIYRFKLIIPDKKILNSLKELFSENRQILQSQIFSYDKSELIKISFLLSKYESLNISKDEAISYLDLIENGLINFGLEQLNLEEIKIIIINFAKNKLNANLELFIHLEPYIIKSILNIDIKTLVTIFYAYLSNYRGSDFFVKTLGFSIKSRIKETSIDGNFFQLL